MGVGFINKICLFYPRVKLLFDHTGTLFNGVPFFRVITPGYSLYYMLNGSVLGGKISKHPFEVAT